MLLWMVGGGVLLLSSTVAWSTANQYCSGARRHLGLLSKTRKRRKTTSPALSEQCDLTE